MAEPWLNPGFRAASRIPKLDTICGKPVSSIPETVQIAGIKPDTILRPPGLQSDLPTITLLAQGGVGRLYWLLNEEMIHHADIGESRIYQFKRPGRYKLTVMDLAGNYDSVDIVVMGAGNSE